MPPVGMIRRKKFSLSPDAAMRDDNGDGLRETKHPRGRQEPHREEKDQTHIHAHSPFGEQE